MGVSGPTGITAQQGPVQTRCARLDRIEKETKTPGELPHLDTPMLGPKRTRSVLDRSRPALHRNSPKTNLCVLGLSYRWAWPTASKTSRISSHPFTISGRLLRSHQTRRAGRGYLLRHQSAKLQARR
ncbi:hypothetical protein DM860_014654 [Cuscuta australis]|uniref:Uncharacterized protein n=1 Tax=Cuscuta australis TaxID=267555 RepID=A0A328DI97_9ASTE|nr:hypothetical protein DM860_014654 [Cuscuta australis]